MGSARAVTGLIGAVASVPDPAAAPAGGRVTGQ
jgi:hypothetical protein